MLPGQPLPSAPIVEGPRISFVLVNYNMRPLVEQCVASIDEDLRNSEVSYEVLVGDNSTDKAYAFEPPTAGTPSTVRLFSLTVGEGWVSALNALLPYARGELIAILHPDVTIVRGCVARLLAFLATNPSVGIVSPSIVYPDGRPCRIRTRLPTTSTEFRRVLNMAIRGLRLRLQFQDEVLWDRVADSETETVMSVFLVLRSAVYQQIAPILPALRTYYGNDYLCLRARRLGWRCFYVRDATVVHHERYAARSAYSAAEGMDYKASPVPASPQMEADHFAFLRVAYPAWRVVLLRILALTEHLIQLAGQLVHARARPGEWRHTWRAILRLLGQR